MGIVVGTIVVSIIVTTIVNIIISMIRIPIVGISSVENSSLFQFEAFMVYGAPPGRLYSEVRRGYTV